MRTIAGIIAGVAIGGSVVAAWAHPGSGSTVAVRMECAQGTVLTVIQDNERSARMRCSAPLTPLPSRTPYTPVATRPAGGGA